MVLASLDSQCYHVVEVGVEEYLVFVHCYDLSGRKVSTPTKGIYLIDGRKVIVK